MRPVVSGTGTNGAKVSKITSIVVVPNAALQADLDELILADRFSTLGLLMTTT